MAAATVPNVLGQATGTCNAVFSPPSSDMLFLRRSIFFDELGDLSTDTNDN